jgi:CubicO group peptidase (beta-lactamase class C family)
MAFPANAQVDKIFAEFDRSGSPGCALAVMKAEHLIYARGYGTADLDHDIPISPRTVFHAASLAKQFTAMCILSASMMTCVRISTTTFSASFLPT